MKFIYPQKYLIAIVACSADGENFTFKKYRHNIKDTPRYIAKFCNDMKAAHADAVHINFYFKDTGAFKEQITLKKPW